MKISSGRGRVSGLLGVAALALGACGPAAKPAAEGGGAIGEAFVYDAAACASSPDLPTSGWDYPQTAAAVQSWVADPDAARGVARERVHGWWLWAALNQAAQTPGGEAPLWRGWCTATQAYAASGGEPPAPAQPPAAPGAATRAAANVQAGLALGATRRADRLASGESMFLPNAPVYQVPGRFVGGKCYDSQHQVLIDGPSFANNGDVMVAGVIYNAPAYNWIRSRGLYLQTTLDGLMPPPGKIGHMADMPRGSVVLKPMMWPVPASGYSALPLWTPPQTDDDTYVGFEVQKKWPRAVAVTAQPRPGVDRVDVTYLNGVTVNGAKYGPNTYRQAPVVPVSRFYAYRPALERMDPCDRAILDSSALYAYGRDFRQGDWLVLIAMHIMTKEQPDWTFQSVWWSDRPDEGVHAADKPIIPAAKGPWRHYLMDSTYGRRDAAGGWGVHFNPYIEPAADHPIATNCMNCHHRAGWPRPPRKPASAYLTQGPTDPGAIGYLANDNPIFQNLVTTDSQWSLANRAKALQASPPAPAGGGGKAKR